MATFWTKKEIDILTELCGKVPIEDIAKILLSRSKNAIRKKIKDLDLISRIPEIDFEYYAKIVGKVGEG